MKLNKVKLVEKTKLDKLRKVKITKSQMVWVLVFIIALILVIRLVYLGAIEIEQFWVEAPFLVSSIVVILACISVWVAVGSLELTRSVMRPFLALQASEVPRKQIQEKVILEFYVKNTGSVPANVFTMEMTFFDDAELIEEDNASKYYPARNEGRRDVVIFPGASYSLEQWFDLSHSDGKKLYEGILNGKVKFRFRTTYGAQGIEYLTVQTEKVLKEVARQMTRLPIQPQIWT